MADAVRSSAEDFVRHALSTIRRGAEAQAAARRAALEDYRFFAGEQWPEDLRAERDRDGRPSLVIPRLKVFVRHLVAELVSQAPSIRLVPRGPAVVEATAIVQEALRHIEQRSFALQQYATAFRHQLISGMGILRVVTEYRSPESFDQELRIVAEPNPLAVYLDPASREPDGADAEWACVFHTLSAEEYHALYGHDPASLPPVDLPVVMPEGSVWVADYYYLEWADDELWRIVDPRAPDQPVDVLASRLGHQLPDGAQLVQRRPTRIRRVRWALLDARHVLEGDETRTAGREWPGTRVPVVPVWGEADLQADQSVRVSGIVRDAKDPCRLYNYFVSAQAEALALAPRAPFIVAEGQIAQYEQLWATAHRRLYPYLPYRAVELAGQLVPPPSRLIADMPLGGIVAALRQADYDLKSVVGRYEPSLGEPSSSRSGRAILALQRQGASATHVFNQAILTAIRGIGRVLLDAMGAIYSPARLAGLSQRPLEEVLAHHAALAAVLDPGRRDEVASLTVGPGEETQRRESVSQLGQIVQLAPSLLPVAGDLWLDQMDLPAARELAARLRRQLPAQLRGDGPPPEVQALEQQVAQLQQELAVWKAKAADRAEDRALRERIERLRGELQVLMTLVQRRDIEPATLAGAIEDVLARLRGPDGPPAAPEGPAPPPPGETTGPGP